MLVRVQGFIQARDKDSFSKIIKSLSPYIVENHFIDKNGEALTEEPNVDEQSLYLEIPFSIYKNMSYIFDHTFATNITKSSDVVFASNDNCFIGGYIRDGQKQSILLEKWADKNVSKKKPDFSNVNDYKNWQNIVIQEFFREYT
jgi:hypothetical protein